MPPSPIKAPAPVARAATINFGDDAFYSVGSRIPEGDYCLYFEMTMHAATDRVTGQARGPQRLGVMVTAYNLHDPQAEPKQQHLGMGTNAHLSYMPNAADEGKSLVAVPGGPGGPVPSSTNWGYFRASLKDCGLPDGVLVNDLRKIDGIHVHLQNVPEPEERKAFRANKQGKTGEAALAGQQEEDFKGPSTIPVVTEIKDTGKPWEGTGGIDVTKPAVAAPVKTAPAPPHPPDPGRVAPPPSIAARHTAPAGDLMDSAMNAIAAVLGAEANVNGMTKLKLRTETFKQVDAETGNAIVNTFFKSDDKLNEILNQLGYQVNGAMVAPQA